MINGTLILNVIHGKELEIEYQKKEIIDKINNHFGYNCISLVKLKIINKEQKTINVSMKINKQSKNFEEKLKTIKSIELKKSLYKLIKAYNEKKN